MTELTAIQAHQPILSCDHARKGLDLTAPYSLSWGFNQQGVNHGKFKNSGDLWQFTAKIHE